MEKSQYSKVFWFFFSKKIRFPYACRIDSANRCNRPVGARGKKELLFEKEAKTFTYSMRVVPHRTHQQVKVFCFFSSEKKTLLFLPRHPGGMKTTVSAAQSAAPAQATKPARSRAVGK
jgi:hypothetical protein